MKAKLQTISSIASILASVALYSTPIEAATVTLAGLAVGDPNPGSAPGSMINGDFTITTCCGHNFVGDATEEWTHWSYDFNSDPELASFSTVTTLSKATLRLQFRSGGDTPWDDVLLVNGTHQPVFGFANRNFTTYDRTLDLLGHFSGIDMLQAIKDHGVLTFDAGNDVLIYSASLTLEGDTVSTVPVPLAFPLFMSGLACLVGVATRRQQ